MRVAFEARTVEDPSGPDRESWLTLLERTADVYPEIELIPIHDSAESPAGWFRFEQQYLPLQAHAAGADLLFVQSSAPAFGSRVPVVAAGWPIPGGRSVSERAQGAVARAGFAAARSRLVYADEVSTDGRAKTVLPSVTSGFTGEAVAQDRATHSRLGLPETYVLSLHPPSDTMEFGLAAWTWVDGSVGESIAWVVAGQPASRWPAAQSQARHVNVADSVRWIPMPASGDLPAVFRGASAYLHLGGAASTQPLRWALAAGVPVVAVHSARAGALLGEAGYLVHEEDSRALGAACLTLLVEPEVAEGLRGKGQQRAGLYAGEGPIRSLRDALAEALEKREGGDRA